MPVRFDKIFYQIICYTIKIFNLAMKKNITATTPKEVNQLCNTLCNEKNLKRRLPIFWQARRKIRSMRWLIIIYMSFTMNLKIIQAE